MAKYGRGLVCLTMTEERLEHLRIGPMTSENTSQYGTASAKPSTPAKA
jgi:3,4-dihydroxy 2-butanone 4-phosphate synthase/GTP cyclohydrolase II